MTKYESVYVCTCMYVHMYVVCVHAYVCVGYYFCEIYLHLKEGSPQPMYNMRLMHPN